MMASWTRTRRKANLEHKRRIAGGIATGILDAHLIRTGQRRHVGQYRPFLPGAGPTVPPVRVLNPDGSLREVVSAQEWRRRHGDPFRSMKEGEHGEGAE